MSLQGKKFAVLVEKFYEDQELWYPVYRLREAGAEVHIVGPKAGTVYESKHGYPAKSDRAAAEVSAADYAGVIIPGGYSPDHMRRHEAMIKFVADAAQGNKIIAAICHAGWMLCSAKVLKGKKCTSFFAIKDDMINAGCEWVDEEVVQDGNLITSRTPADLPAFMKAILAAAEQA